MPFLVEHLIEGKPLPVTAQQDDPIANVLSRMLENDFSQLPVVDGEIPLGMVTYEGILRGVRNFKTDVDQLYVRDVMESAPILHHEDDLFDLLELLKLKNAVLIEDMRGHLIGIVTSYDSTEYFRDRAEHLMRVEDIETTIKEIILVAYTIDSDEIDQAKLSEAVAKVDFRENKQGKRKSYEELSLGQYISLLLAKNTWSSFEPIFEISRDSVRHILEDIRDIRNDLAHFRSELLPEQIDQLRFCADWVTRKWEEYQKRKQDEQIVKGIEKEEQPDQIVIAEETLPRESRYVPFADWLQSQPGSVDQIKLKFEDVEKIIGGELPNSAFKHRAWWANDSVAHHHSRLWLEVGWRRSYLSMTGQHVTFVRIKEREKAYIKFFNETIASLRRNADFPLQDISPDGQSWVTCQVISSPGPIIAHFNFSFARGKRFRVELYIDTGEKDTTKQIFDQIHEKKSELEHSIGKIAWERIDDKRASRIAVYQAGVITDNEDVLSKLQDWAVDKMISFYNAIEPIASRAAKEALST